MVAGVSRVHGAEVATAHLQVPIVRVHAVHANACAARDSPTMPNRRNQKCDYHWRARTFPAAVISHCRYYSLSPLRCRSKMHTRVLERAPGEA